MFILVSRKLNSGEKIRLVWDRVGNPLFCSTLLILKSDCVQFALVALYKRATMSKLLLLLCKKEQHGWFARASRESLSKMSDLLKKIHIFLFVFDSFSLLFPFLCPRANRSHRSLLFAPNALYKRATMSDWLLSLMTKERQERFVLFYRRIALSLTKIKWFASKTDERIPNPGLRTFQKPLSLCAICENRLAVNTLYQGWEFAFWMFERIAHFLWGKSDLLLWLFCKELREQMAHIHSFVKSNGSNLLTVALF